MLPIQAAFVCVCLTIPCVRAEGPTVASVGGDAPANRREYLAAVPGDAAFYVLDAIRRLT